MRPVNRVMKRHSRVGWTFAAIFCACTLAACRGEDGAGALAQAQILDANHGSQIPGFWFLEPFVDVDQAMNFHTFAANANPSVTVQEVTGNGLLVGSVLATFTANVGPRYRHHDGRWINEFVRRHDANGRCDDDDDDGDDDHGAYYYVRIDADDINFVDGRFYRVSVTAPVLGASRRLGFADIQVVRSEKLAKRVDENNFVPLVRGHGVRVKFRVDSDALDPCLGVVCTALDQCHGVGVCQNGVCTNPAKPDGTACNEAQGKVCSGGACVPPPPLFSAAVNYPVGENPKSLVAGDWNRDGKADLAVANITSSDVSVLLGVGDGTFHAAVRYPVSAGPTGVTAGDWNGDGKLDLATSNHLTNEVSVLMGVGNGTFQAAVSYPVGTEPNSVSSGDWNRDGKTDLVVANYAAGGPGGVSLLLGAGDGTFDDAVEVVAVLGPIMAIGGDWNVDGFADIAVVSNSSDTIAIALGDGNGAFAAPSNFAVRSQPSGISAGDWNNDGKPDLAVANNNSRTFSVLIGLGGGTFAPAVDYPAATTPTSLAAGDWDGDGHLDLVVTNVDSDAINVYLGRGDGTFDAASDSTAGASPYSVVAGDWDGDGKPDLAVVNVAGNDVSILMNASP